MRRFALAWLALALTLALLSGAGHAATLKASLLLQADDPRLSRSRVELAYLGHPGGPASDGVALALDEAKLELDAAGSTISLETVSVASAAAAREAALRADKAGAVALLADLPADWLLAVADATTAPVLNLGEPADRLRQADCRANLLHLIPSERMRADALAQGLLARKWRDVLMLVGPDPLDAERAATAAAAITRYGLKLVASKPFKRSADPRQRDAANPLLLTATSGLPGGTYDLVWVVDSDGEFARSLPYRIALPRPLVGDAGLLALAWAPGFDRFGAPQLARRFAKAARRPMTDHDWAAWAGAKALVAAAVAQPRGTLAAIRQTLVEGPLDGSKGVLLGFRPWDGQLRQPLLLADGQGVVGLAPIDGILHPKNALDTLGADAPEQRCKVSRK